MFLAACLSSTVLATVFGGPGATAQTPDVASAEVEVECPEPSPSPSPTDTPTPIETLDPTLPTEEPEDECDDDSKDDEDGNNGGNKGDDDGDDNKPDRSDDPKDDDGNDPKDDDRGNGPDKRSGKGGDSKDKKGKDGKSKKKKKDDVDTSVGPKASRKFNATGEFDTDRLQLIAAQLRARGLTEDEVLKRVYTPFIIGGPAAWTDTWGAPRYGPGPIVRTHEGQDVFCKYGDPILAARSGEIEFDDGGLGGKVARLYSKDGSYFYYAHLSGWNTKDFENGDRVEAGDVIGFCGNTGNAITTPPHVHFGWYKASGESKDPMRLLVRWLRAAERNAGAAYKKATGRSIDALEQSGSSRLFGDGFAPDISELKVSSEALLAATSSPGAGGLGLADSALQAALAGQADSGFDGDVEVGSEGAGDDHSELAELLDSQSETTSPATGD